MNCDNLVRSIRFTRGPLNRTREISACRWPSMVLLVCVAVYAGFALARFAAARSDPRRVGALRLSEAVESLRTPWNGDSGGPQTFRRALELAESELSVAAWRNPTNGAVLANLAAVRWELENLGQDGSEGSVSGLIELASIRAPRNPTVQISLSALLLRMGAVDEASRLLSRAAALSPSALDRVVGVMKDAGWDYQRAVRTLGDGPNVMLALKAFLTDRSSTLDWLTATERFLTQAPGALLSSYADVCLDADQPTRLLSFAETLPSVLPANVEGDRQIARGRALVALGRGNEAAVASRRAVSAADGDARILELAGQVSLLSGAFSDAESEFRRALEIAVKAGATSRRRAILYRERAQALDSLGRIEEAFDELKRSSEADPNDEETRAMLQNRFHGPSLDRSQ